MNLILQREEYGNNYTKGSLYIDGVFECYTLEDKDRNLEKGGDKVDKKTAIPKAIYKVIIDLSDRFKRLMPHILDVLGFKGIRIHWGNTDVDTEGCILVGVNKGQGDFIGQSRVAFDALYLKLKTAFDNGEEIWLTIQ